MAKSTGIDYIKNNSISPKGKVKWAFTAKPDDKYGEPKYKVELWYDKKDKDMKAFAVELLAAENAYRKEHDKPAIKTPSALKADKNTGEPFFRFECKPRVDPTTGVRMPLPIVDAHKQRCDNIPVFRDDIVRVASTWGGWMSEFGIGVKLYLNSVQLLESNYKPGGYSGVDLFSEEEGFSGGDTFVGDEKPEVGGEEPPFAEETKVDEKGLL